MSKVVKAVTNVVSSVVKGAVSAVKSVAKGVGSLVKNIASSKLGKAIVIAAAVYFGGAALAGGFSSSAAGGSFLSGMGTGVANAASSLSTAWGSAMSGNFSQAGSALSAGFQGEAAGAAAAQASGTGAMTVGNTAANATNAANTAGAVNTTAGTVGATNGMTQAQMLAAQNAGVAGADSLTAAALKTGATTTAPASAGFFSSDLAKYGAITAGTQLAGGLISGAGQKQAMEDQRDYEARLAQEQRDRYNANVGTSLWAETQPVNPVTGLPNPTAWDPVAEARAINARYANPSAAQTGGAGVISRAMQPTNPTMAGSNYPVYNPYYNRNFAG